MRGVEAARILIEQQQKGLEMLTARGILVKVNSVLIPGVNDQHLKEVSKVVKAKGDVYKRQPRSSSGVQMIGRNRVQDGQRSFPDEHR